MDNTTAHPLAVEQPLTDPERLARLETLAERHRDDEGVPALGEEELLVVAELLGQLNTITNPGPADTDGWGRLAAQMASRIYQRLGI